MAFLRYEEGDKGFVPMIITIDNPTSLQVLYEVIYSARAQAHGTTARYSLADEFVKAIEDSAKNNSVAIRNPF